jgi:hypothetical protein
VYVIFVGVDFGRCAKLLHADDRPAGSRSAGRLALGACFIQKYQILTMKEPVVIWRRLWPGLRRGWRPSGRGQGRSIAIGSQVSGNFIMVCRAFENNAHVPGSFQIFIARLPPALYEARNTGRVGHVGSNHIDATLVASMCD